MNKFITLLIITFLFVGIAVAQNNENKADDASRIAITPQVSDQDIPANAQKMLTNKMRQICTKNGLSGDSENALFTMDASIDILSKDITPTAPPMHALSMQINFYIKGADGNVYSETSYTTKGVGKSETKAYIAGIKNINTSRGQFKAMVDKGKQKIIEYYNSDCDFIISKATALNKNGSYKEASELLLSVPKVCKECYDMSMELLSEITPVETTTGKIAPCTADSIVSRFYTDDEGWLVVGDAKEATAKPVFTEGYLSADDNATGGVWYWSAPQDFLGNLSCFYGGTLSFVLKQSSTDNQFDDADVVLESGDLKIVYDTKENPGIGWTSYTIPLSESEWKYSLSDTNKVSKDDFMTIIYNITALYIRGEFVDGEDTGAIDNIIISK